MRILREDLYQVVIDVEVAPAYLDFADNAH
jgi:hypothetical protein